VRATTNECNTTEPEPFFQCESSDRRRRSEIDREIALVIRRLDRSHGRPLTPGKASNGAPLQDGSVLKMLVYSMYAQFQRE
jgi:hypothetical protein